MQLSTYTFDMLPTEVQTCCISLIEHEIVKFRSHDPEWKLFLKFRLVVSLDIFLNIFRENITECKLGSLGSTWPNLDRLKFFQLQLEKNENYLNIKRDFNNNTKINWTFNKIFDNWSQCEQNIANVDHNNQQEDNTQQFESDLQSQFSQSAHQELSFDEEMIEIMSPKKKQKLDEKKPILEEEVEESKEGQLLSENSEIKKDINRLKAQLQALEKSKHKKLPDEFVASFKSIGEVIHLNCKIIIMIEISKLDLVCRELYDSISRLHDDLFVMICNELIASVETSHQRCKIMSYRILYPKVRNIDTIYYLIFILMI
jgi:hypothetical protein